MADGIDRLASEGVEFVQVLYTELHGVCRGKEVPIEEIHHKVESGIGLTEAIMTIDLRHNVISGFEHGFRDIFLVPDLSRILRVPWDPATVWCMGDLMEGDGAHYAADARHAVRRAAEALAERGLRAIVAPELEFYLVDPDTYEPYTPHLSSVYTVGSVADPRGVFREIHRNARDLGLHPLGGAQEYGCGQFEINLAHGEALEVSDRNLVFKTMVKQTAARHGLLATFMGRLRDDEGSGLHVHVSLMNDDGTNAFEDTGDPDGLSDLARQFGAGVLEHTPALTAFLCPTVNAYRRMLVESLAPTHVNWGLDNRLAMLRVPGAARQGDAARGAARRRLGGDPQRGRVDPVGRHRRPRAGARAAADVREAAVRGRGDARATAAVVARRVARRAGGRRVPVRADGRPADRDLPGDQAVRARPLGRRSSRA